MHPAAASGRQTLDFSAAIFQPNISKQLKGLDEQALLTTPSVLDPAVGQSQVVF